MLNSALSVKVSVALGSGPEAGAVYKIVAVQMPPVGNVVGKEIASFEQLIGPTLNVVVAGEIDALLSSRPIEFWPPSHTVRICVPICPVATFPKPRLLVENDATGAARPLCCVTNTWSFTVIGSLMVIGIVDGGSAGVGAVVPPPLSEIDCI